jgi:L-methionine (R)-S-oxide reductase
MAEELTLTATTKAEKYKELYPQVQALLHGETDTIAKMANLCAALKQSMNFLWVGFYLVKNNELVLGPFQGPVACMRIPYGKGVCGKAWELKNTIIVDDVEQFPGHIACSSLSKSEIVLPLRNSNKEVTAVLDIDSDAYATFDRTDEDWLKMMVELV